MNVKFPISLRNYITGSNSDTYTIIIQNYYKGVYDIIVDLLKANKGFDESGAVDFTDILFSKSSKQCSQIKGIIEVYYSDGKTKKECADTLMDKFYKITRINIPSDQMGQERVTGVNENNGSVSKRTSPKMFEILVNKLSKIGLKFNLNTQHIKNKSNSLNNKNYMLYMSTDFTSSPDLVYEFKYNKFFADMVKMFSEANSEVSFYVGVSNKSILHYGFIIGDKRYEIGHIKYTSNDIFRLFKASYSISEIDYRVLASRFKSTINELYHIKDVVKEHTKNYSGVYVYVDIVNNSLMLVIENDDQGILSEKYISYIIENNAYSKSRYTFKIDRIEKSGKEKYKIYVNK